MLGLELHGHITKYDVLLAMGQKLSLCALGYYHSFIFYPDAPILDGSIAIYD